MAFALAHLSVWNLLPLNDQISYILTLFWSNIIFSEKFFWIRDTKKGITYYSPSLPSLHFPSCHLFSPDMVLQTCLFAHHPSPPLGYKFRKVEFVLLTIVSPVLSWWFDHSLNELVNATGSCQAKSKLPVLSIVRLQKKPEAGTLSRSPQEMT